MELIFNLIRFKSLLTFLLPLFCLSGQSAGFSEYDGGLKVKLNESGSKYFRILLWGQFWAQYNNNVPEGQSEFNLSVRRTRILMYSQLSDKFLILTHFGLNSLNRNNMSPQGKATSVVHARFRVSTSFQKIMRWVEDYIIGMVFQNQPTKVRSISLPWITTDLLGLP